MTVYLLVQDAGDEPEMETFHSRYETHKWLFSCMSIPSITTPAYYSRIQVARSGCTPVPSTWFRIRAKQPNRTAKVQARGSQVQDATCGRALYYCSVALIKAQKCQSGMVA